MYFIQVMVDALHARATCAILTVRNIRIMYRKTIPKRKLLLGLAIRREMWVERTRRLAPRSSNNLKYWAPDHGITIAVDGDCNSYSFAMVTINGSIKCPWSPPSIGMIVHQSGGQQRCQNRRPAGAIKIVSKFDGASASQTKSIVSIDLLPLSCVIFSLGPMLICYDIGDTIAIVHRHREGRCPQQSWRPASSSLSSQAAILRCKITLHYRLLYVGNIQAPPEASVASYLQSESTIECRFRWSGSDGPWWGWQISNQLPSGRKQSKRIC